MVTAPVASGKDNDANREDHNVVVKSEIADVVHDGYSVPQHAVPANGDPIVTLGRFTDDVQYPESDGDSTECSCSSSFDASYSLSEDDMESDTGAMEVNSVLQSHTQIDDTTAMPHLVRKRKVTDEWRKYIGPVMWRCQWLELRMKDLLSQVEKYDKELAIINHEKDLQLEMMKADCPNSGLLQLDLQSHERNTMKRRKRKRDEDITDSSLSTEKHPILSYYNEKQKKKTETDELFDDDDDDDNFNSLAVENTKNSLGLNDTLAWLEFKENNSDLEQYSLRDIFFQIDGMQSRIISLQNHLSKALNTMAHSQKTKVQKNKKLHGFLQKNTGSEDITLPHEDEITVGMLFDIDNPLVDAGIRGLYKDSADDILIDNQAAREEGYCQFERVNQKAEKHLELVKSVDETPSPEEEKDSTLTGTESVSVPSQIITQVNKRGPKPKNKLSTKMKKTEEDFDNSNIERTMLVAVDTRRSQRVRKPRIL